jgi:hypothetical protein
MKPVYRVASLVAVAFAVGLAAGHGLGLRGSSAYNYTDSITNPAPATTEAPGYKNLIPGYIPPEPEPQMAQEPQAAPETPPVATAPQTAPTERPRTFSAAPTPPVSGDPAYLPPRPIRNANDVRVVGLERKLKLDFQNANMPPELEKTFHDLLHPEGRTLLAQPGRRIQGMLPEEFSNKMRIDELMEIVRHPAQTDLQKKANARAATEKLQQFANALNARQGLPDVFFEKAGVPEIYLKEQHEMIDNSLRRVEEAVRELERYK